MARSAGQRGEQTVERERRATSNLKQVLPGAATLTGSLAALGSFNPRMQNFGRHAILIAVATIFATGAYCLALQIIWQQDIGREIGSVLFAALSSLVLAYPLVYLPVLRLLERKLHGTKPYVLFPLIAMIVGVAPVGLINLRWNAGLQAMLSPESQLFYIYFTVVGIVIGGLYPLLATLNTSSELPKTPIATNNPMDRSGGSAAS